MEIFIDLRCLQDENYARRGVGYHSSLLLSDGRNYLPSGSRLVGLVDPALPPLAGEFRTLVDETKTTFANSRASASAAFIALSPMTHDPTRLARLVGQASIFSAAIVYDFIPFDLSDRYLSHPVVADRYAAQLAWLPSYHHFFPISDYSANRLRDLFPIPEHAIDVTGVALRPIFEQAMGSQRSVFGTPKSETPMNYLLCVAGSDRRKNVGVLLKAHAKLVATHRDLHLLIVGSYSRRQLDEMYAEYRSCGGPPKLLQIHQNIDDARLCHLYRHAKASICCSEMEGFSLPVIESIASGCPVLVSDIAAHRELVGDSQAIFSAHDGDGLHDRLHPLLEGSLSRARLLDEQQPIPARFLASKVSERFWTPICRGIRALRRSSSDRCRRGSMAAVRTANRPRLAILSPFPPDASGIADYTRRTVQALGRFADVDVYSLASHPTPTAEVQNFFPLSDIAFLSGAYDSVVSVVGNSPFHTRIIELLMRHGGPCLIHDNRLAELYCWWRGPEAFQAMAARSLGRPVSYRESQAWIEHPGTLPSLFFDELIPHAQPLLVHSRGIQARVQEQYAIEAKQLPFCVYRDFDPQTLTPQAKRMARRKLDMADDVTAIVTLGIVSPTKGPRQCIEAISIARQSGLNAELYFVGTASGYEKRIQGWTSDYGLDGKIHVLSDWVDSSKYRDYIVAADMGIQLRNHFSGGLSGALMDCIASGLVTVANADLAESLEAPSNVLRISDSLLPQELAEQVLKAHRTRDLDQRLTAEREAYVLAHSFDTYAVQFLEAIGLKAEDEKPSRARRSA